MIKPNLKPKPKYAGKLRQITVETNRYISPFKNIEKSIPVSECLKARLILTEIVKCEKLSKILSA